MWLLNAHNDVTFSLQTSQKAYSGIIQKTKNCCSQFVVRFPTGQEIFLFSETSIPGIAPTRFVKNERSFPSKGNGGGLKLVARP